MEYLLFFYFYYFIMTLNVGLNEKLDTFPKSQEYDNSDTWVMYIPILNCVSLIILIIRYFQWK